MHKYSLLTQKNTVLVGNKKNWNILLNEDGLFIQEKPVIVESENDKTISSEQSQFLILKNPSLKITEKFSLIPING